MMHYELPDLLPNRLNDDAIAYLGCTLKEIQTMAIFNLIFSIIVLGFLCKALLGLFLVGMGFAFPATIGLTLLMMKGLQKAKQGKPRGYVKQTFLLWCEQKGICQTPYIRYSGQWSIGRLR